MTPNYDVSGYLRAKFHLTPAQIEFIERNPHLSPCDTLPDGDVLCLDRQSTDDKQFGPYI